MMAKEADIFHHEAQMIIAALMAVSPAGGSTMSWRLASKLALAYEVDTGTDEFQEEVANMASVPVKEWLETEDLYPLLDRSSGLQMRTVPGVKEHLMSTMYKEF
jgi:hypothetical protein